MIEVISQDEILELNKKVEIPLLLTFLGADAKTIKPAKNHTEYRTNAFWRGGDNDSGLYILYDFNDGRWRFTDVTSRSIVNADVIDFVMKVGGKTFRRAIEFIIFCSGKDDNYAVNLQVQQPQKKERAMPIDPTILETYQFGLHPYMAQRGFTPETAERFKLGWCNYGELRDRIIFPIYSEMNTLCAVQGRSMDDRVFPKYSFLSGTGENAKLTLYNYQHAKIRGSMERGWVGITEGINSVMRAEQYGYKNFLATLSTSVTNRQLELLMNLNTNLVIFFDYDDTPEMPGQVAAINLANNLKRRGHQNIYIVNIGFHAGADDLTQEQFFMSLKNAIKY